MRKILTMKTNRGQGLPLNTIIIAIIVIVVLVVIILIFTNNIKGSNDTFSKNSISDCTSNTDSGTTYRCVLPTSGPNPCPKVNGVTGSKNTHNCAVGLVCCSYSGTAPPTP